MATAIYDATAGQVVIALSEEENQRAKALQQQAGDMGIAGLLSEIVTGALEREIKARYESLLNQEREKVRQALARAGLSELRQIQQILGF